MIGGVHCIQCGAFIYSRTGYFTGVFMGKGIAIHPKCVGEFLGGNMYQVGQVVNFEYNAQSRKYSPEHKKPVAYADPQIAQGKILAINECRGGPRAMLNVRTKSGLVEKRSVALTKLREIISQ